MIRFLFDTTLHQQKMITMKAKLHELKNLKTKLLSKSITKLLLSVILLSTILVSCKKENATPEGWQFTKLVNITTDNDGYMVSLDFYQKKGNEWRIVQMSPDDYTKFNLERIITPTAFELPTNNTNSFITTNVRLFDPADDKVYNQGNLRWPLGDAVGFKTFNTFIGDFPDMPITSNKISKFSAATFSLEQAYDNNSKTSTYIFYDFPNQKYLYYGFRTGADLILENNLSDICPTCENIPWKTIDAVTCTNEKTNPDNYYFFDFDGQKLYIIDRINKNTNNPSFQINSTPIDFKDAFFNEFGSNNGNELPFDFSK